MKIFSVIFAVNSYQLEYIVNILHFTWNAIVSYVRNLTTWAGDDFFIR